VIRYGRRHSLRRSLSQLKHSLCPPRMYLDSLIKKVEPHPLGCMVCVYDEQATIVDALKTTINAVDFYVVVDKNGGTIDTIRDSGLEINAEYYVKPDLTLAESRAYALKHLQQARWVLIQDGDEFYTEQLNHLPRERPHIYYRSRKNLIYPDQTMPLYQQGYHNFLLHNNGTLRIPFPNDIPRMTGRAIYLTDIMIWNYHHKNRPKPQTIHYTSTMGPIPTQLEALM